MLSLPFLVLGKPKTKSILISIQGELGTGKGIYKPCGIDLDLPCLQAKQALHNLETSFFMFGQKKCSFNMFKVLSIPKCPIKPPQCASKTSNSWMALTSYRS